MTAAGGDARWAPAAADGQSPEDLSLDEWVGQALGAASSCWSNLEGAGVFDSTRCAGILVALLSHLTKVMAGRRVAEWPSLTPPDEWPVGVKGVYVELGTIGRPPEGDPAITTERLRFGAEALAEGRLAGEVEDMARRARATWAEILDGQGRFDVLGFPAAIDRIRVLRGLRWKDVAEQAGVSASTLTRLTQGNRPDVDSFAKLIAWAGLSADEFVVRGA